MKIFITGATGYVGKSLLKILNKKKIDTYLLTRRKIRNKKFFIFYGSLENPPKEIFKMQFDILLHLAWDNLDNYNSKNHFKTLKIHKKFLKKMLNCKIKKIIVAGTCAEYGKKDGKLREYDNVKPKSNYAIAKNNFRIYIDKLIKNKNIIFNWLRIFYLYGAREPKKTLIGQLKYAIKKNKKSFKMSSGNQYKDYVSINVLTNLIMRLIINDYNYKIINCCSGKSLKIINLVKSYLRKKRIKIITNFYNISKNEPINAYGSNFILKKIIK